MNRAIVSVTSLISFGIVVEVYRAIMDEVEERFQTSDNIYIGLYIAFKKEMVRQEEDMATKTKEEMTDRMREAEQRDLIEANRAARVERQLQNKTQLVHVRADADAVARAGPVVPPVVPVVPGAPPVIPAILPHRHYKEVSSLHLGQISIEISPEELRTFETNFRNWYQISNVDTLNPAQQIFTLKKCCSLAIQQIIDWINLDTIDAALAAVRALWDIQYPLITRRLEFLRNKQLESESVEEFILCERQLFITGDIEHFTAVQLQIVKIISGLRDTKLQVKLLELPAAATLAKVDNTWRAYTANNLTST